MFENYEDEKTAIMETLLRELKDNERIPEKIRKSFVLLINGYLLAKRKVWHELSDHA